MNRRLLAVPILAIVALLPLGTAVSEGHRAATTTTTEVAPSTETTDALPGTTLEAADRTDDTSPAPWLIGSGIAAVAAVAIGGTLLKRRAE